MNRLLFSAAVTATFFVVVGAYGYGLFVLGQWHPWAAIGALGITAFGAIMWSIYSVLQVPR